MPVEFPENARPRANAEKPNLWIAASDGAMGRVQEVRPVIRCTRGSLMLTDLRLQLLNEGFNANSKDENGYARKVLMRFSDPYCSLKKKIRSYTPMYVGDFSRHVQDEHGS